MYAIRKFLFHSWPIQSRRQKFLEPHPYLKNLKKQAPICAKSILSTKLARVVFLSGREPVDKASVLDFLGQGGIEVVEVDANDLA